MYVYVQSEPGLYSVGFYDPQGVWHPETDHSSREAAANRVAWLNGSGRTERMELWRQIAASKD
jgi:hypothetical protein